MVLLHRKQKHQSTTGGKLVDGVKGIYGPIGEYNLPIILQLFDVQWNQNFYH